MKRAIVIQHVSFEGLGHIGPMLEERGYQITTHVPPSARLSSIAPESIDLLILLGGPMSANDGGTLDFIADEIRLAAVALRQGIPSLGICLGAQVIAKAAGGSIRSMEVPEIEIAPVTLTPAARNSPLRHLDGSQPVLHWHGESIDLPAHATRLAETSKCEVQAFSIGLRTLGLQFHIEADLRDLTSWTTGHASDVRQAGVDPSALVELGALNSDAVRDVCRRVIGEWLDSIQNSL
ncbi:glutamine amidotransferase-related protein [Luteimonas saliphila]|uniref:glutamine amidotransferase-related protein n=1 Tax=Luteimonas saliphila TaxID=2804919 RepID=UPI00192DD433|nr:gamma-glutamyl-gamma-aminobutyrate hydrolase family protein [Luteimonas saliphila]